MRDIIFEYPLRDTIQCPIGIDVDDPHTYVQGTGLLAFCDIMGLPGNIREVCLTCAHPSNMPVVDGGLELAPDMRVYTVLVDGVNYNDHTLTAQEATDIAYGWQIAGSENVVIEISPKSSQVSLYQSELLELTHRTQVAIFGWCGCEDNAGMDNPYADCPITEPTIICQWCDSLNLIFYGYSPMSVETEYKCQDCHKKTYIDDRPATPIID